MYKELVGLKLITSTFKIPVVVEQSWWTPTQLNIPTYTANGEFSLFNVDRGLNMKNVCAGHNNM